MTLPFGIAIYPDRGKSTLDPLPRITLTRTYHESAAGRIEDEQARLVTTHYRKVSAARYGDDYERPRSARGLPGRETASVRRRPTPVGRELADRIMLAVIDERQRHPRSRLARWIGITPRQLHLAELGSVQLDSVRLIADYFGIDIEI